MCCGSIVIAADVVVVVTVRLSLVVAVKLGLVGLGPIVLPVDIVPAVVASVGAGAVAVVDFVTSECRWFVVGQGGL